MTVTDDVTPELRRIMGELERLSKMTIHIGIQGAPGRDHEGKSAPGAPADLLTIANVHEFGATIKAKNVKNLAIPIAEKAVGKSPRDFKDIFFLETDDYVYACIDKEEHKKRPAGKPSNLKPKDKKPENRPIKTGKEGDIEFLFILFPSVSIPERSFIRAGYDNNREEIEKAAKAAVGKILFEGYDADRAAEYVGMAAAQAIWVYINTSSNFKGKGEITKATSNWPNSPLIETARLRNSITYRIEEG